MKVRRRAPKRAVAVGAAVIAVITLSSVVAADSGGGGVVQLPAPPGTPISDGTRPTAESSGQIENIITNVNPFGGPPVYDPTILTKFISGRGFVANQGPDGV